MSKQKTKNFKVSCVKCESKPWVGPHKGLNVATDHDGNIIFTCLECGATEKLILG